MKKSNKTKLVYVLPLFAIIFCCNDIRQKQIQEQEQKPNILLIMADDLNDYVGVMNSFEGLQTPNIDKLASNGSLFLNAHSNAPICGPSRSSMFTGVYPHRSGNTGFKNWRKNEGLANSKTIMEQFM